MLTAIGIVVFYVSAALLLWRRFGRESFQRQVTYRVRGWWRRIGYVVHWRAGTINMGLTGKRLVVKHGRDGTWEKVPTVDYPTMQRVRSSRSVDRVRVLMLPGQVLEDWTENAERLATLFNAQECRIRSPRGGRLRSHRRYVDLTFLRTDVLREPVRSQPLAEVSDFKALPVALTEDGEPYRLRLLGTHLLVSGATGSGKGSALWSVVEQLAPAIPAGLVRLTGIDPKELELTMAPRLFADLVGGDGQKVAECLEAKVAAMDARKVSMRGRSRLHQPTTAEPFEVIIIDEANTLTAYGSDREATKRIEKALGKLLAQGRALGFSLILAAQDPRKETIGFRSLIPTRVALRVNEANETDMILGDGARARGALADRISPDTPGVAYVLIEGMPEPVRIRYPYISDERLAELSRFYSVPGPLAPVLSLASPRPAGVGA